MMNIDLARLATLLPRVLQGVVSTSVLSLVILFILSIDRRSSARPVTCPTPARSPRPLPFSSVLS